jgi:hypothetical protein
LCIKFCAVKDASEKALQGLNGVSQACDLGAYVKVIERSSRKCSTYENISQDQEGILL